VENTVENPKRIQSLLTTIACLSMGGCAALAPDPCPPILKASADPGHSILLWGKDRASAEIGHVVAECVAMELPVTKESPKGGRAYSIIATATAAGRVLDTIADQNPYRPTPKYTASVLFEALSKSGVVLGTGYGSFTVIRGDDSTTVTGRVDGLTREEVVRVDRVRVRWQYDR
jgi:hypothetical protein